MKKETLITSSSEVEAPICPLPDDLPALRKYPSKLYVEVTSRCNLRCAMCVKQTEGCGIVDGDMALETFEALMPALENIESLILNGVGEPLLHLQLELFIRKAKTRMEQGAWIGFQTNGLLLDEDRAVALAQAGLDRICLSMDGTKPETFRDLRSGGELDGVERAFSALKKAKDKTGREDLKIGVEFVLRRDNMAELPETLRWAGRRGVSFAIVTHMISYDAEISSNVAYDQNTDAALLHLEEWREKADRQGVEIANYFKVRWKYVKTPDEQRIVDFVQEMTIDAADRGIFFHLKNLIERDGFSDRNLPELFAEAEKIAREAAIDLRLPALMPKARKKCDFIESGGVFVSFAGDIHPCYFLWHRYSCYVSGWHKFVNPEVFGNLGNGDILEIWNSNEFRSFRETVVQYDYPLCSNCNFAPCDYIDSETFEQDCYTNTIPCCDCQWCLGVFQCLQ
jgi:putative metalloenzyme radical SAM/SPASM domain maturase